MWAYTNGRHVLVEILTTGQMLSHLRVCLEELMPSVALVFANTSNHTARLMSFALVYIYIYRIVPNRRAVREWEGLGASLLISQKWDECGYPLDQLLN